jgi:hypothetical protein
MSEKKPVINETSVIFDKNLIELIEEIRETVNIAPLRRPVFKFNNSITKILNCQENIREYFVKHQKRLNFSNKRLLSLTNNKSFPDFFALMICVITDLDRCQSFEEVFEQNFVKDGFIDYCIGRDLQNRDPTSTNFFVCACNKQRIEYIYEITNQSTYYRLILGSSCIGKNLIKNAEDKKAFTKAKNRVIKEINDIKKYSFIRQKWTELLLRAVKHNNKLYRQNIFKQFQLSIKVF